jgi:hypothetical protein
MMLFRKTTNRLMRSVDVKASASKRSSETSRSIDAKRLQKDFDRHFRNTNRTTATTAGSNHHDFIMLRQSYQSHIPEVSSDVDMLLSQDH